MNEDANVAGIRVSFEEKSGLVFCQSPDMKGLLLVGESREDILAKAPMAIAEMVLLGGMERRLLEKLEDVALLRMHDDIHKIMEQRSVDMKARFKAAQAPAA